MKPVLWFMLLLLIACDRNDTLPDCTPERWSYTLQTAKAITIDTFEITTSDTAYTRYTYQIAEGANLVFDYTHDFEDCRQIADDEQTDRIIFELPTNATYVKWEDSAAFAQAKVFYHRIGAWGTSPEPVVSGVLEGRKINGNRWHITASLQPASKNGVVDFDHDFTP